MDNIGQHMIYHLNPDTEILTIKDDNILEETPNLVASNEEMKIIQQLSQLFNLSLRDFKTWCREKRGVEVYLPGDDTVHQSTTNNTGHFELQPFEDDVVVLPVPKADQDCDIRLALPPDHSFAYVEEEAVESGKGLEGEVVESYTVNQQDDITELVSQDYYNQASSCRVQETQCDGQNDLQEEKPNVNDLVGLINAEATEHILMKQETHDEVLAEIINEHNLQGGVTKDICDTLNACDEIEQQAGVLPVGCNIDNPEHVNTDNIDNSQHVKNDNLKPINNSELDIVFKLQVAGFYELVKNESLTAQTFNVSEENVRDWYGDKSSLIENLKVVEGKNPDIVIQSKHMEKMMEKGLNNAETSLEVKVKMEKNENDEDMEQVLDEVNGSMVMVCKRTEKKVEENRRIRNKRSVSTPKMETVGKRIRKLKRPYCDDEVLTQEVRNVSQIKKEKIECSDLKSWEEFKNSLPENIQYSSTLDTMLWEWVCDKKQSIEANEFRKKTLKLVESVDKIREELGSNTFDCDEEFMEIFSVLHGVVINDGGYVFDGRTKSYSGIDDDNYVSESTRIKRAFPVNFKLQVIAHFEKVKSKSATAKKFNIARKQVQSWVQKRDLIFDNRDLGSGCRIPKTCRGIRSATLDNKLLNWITNVKSHKKSVTQAMIQEKALALYKEDKKIRQECSKKGFQNFSASLAWVRSFQRRNSLD